MRRWRVPGDGRCLHQQSNIPRAPGYIASEYQKFGEKGLIKYGGQKDKR